MKQKVGAAAIWVGFIICAIIIFLDKGSGLWSYIGASVLVVASLIGLYCIYKKDK